MLINFEIILILPVLNAVSKMKGTDGPTELIRTQRLKKEVHCERKFIVKANLRSLTAWCSLMINTVDLHVELASTKLRYFSHLPVFFCGRDKHEQP